MRDGAGIRCCSSLAGSLWNETENALVFLECFFCPMGGIEEMVFFCIFTTISSGGNG